MFIRVPANALRDAAGATGAWANRFGIVVDTSGDSVIAESALAWTKLTPLSRFVARTDGGRIALAVASRRRAPMRSQVHATAEQRIDALLGNRFNLRTRRGFCARYVSDVLGADRDATPAALLRSATLSLEFDGIVFDPGRPS